MFYECYVDDSASEGFCLKNRFRRSSKDSSGPSRFFPVSDPAVSYTPTAPPMKAQEATATGRERATDRK